MALADKYYTIGVLGKSFGVIELMAHQAKWELRDLAKASGLPKGTLQRIFPAVFMIVKEVRPGDCRKS